MRKIPTLYVRDPQNMKRVTDEVTPGCEWVPAGEGKPTRKIDGTCVALLDVGPYHQWYARREIKPNKDWPANFIEEEFDPNTGKRVGWEPIEQSPFVKFWTEAYRPDSAEYPLGTYELCGPKINGNPELLTEHTLFRHADAVVLPHGLSPLELIQYCRQRAFEGVVWHHEDGRMAKLKVRDYR